MENFPYIPRNALKSVLSLFISGLLSCSIGHEPQVPVHVVEEARGSLVMDAGGPTYRKRRTVLAPAVSGLLVEMEDLKDLDDLASRHEQTFEPLDNYDYDYDWLSYSNLSLTIVHS